MCAPGSSAYTTGFSDVARSASTRARAPSTGVNVLAGLGSADPARDVRHVLAFMDGLVGHQFASAQPDFDPAVAFAALLRGLIDRELGSSGGHEID